MLEYLLHLWQSRQRDCFCGAARSPKWPGVRRAHLLKYPQCAACGGMLYLNVHHVIPFYIDPAVELAPENLLTLCEHPTHNCHFTFGHLLSWSRWNVHVRQDADLFYQRLMEAKRRQRAA